MKFVLQHLGLLLGVLLFFIAFTLISALLPDKTVRQHIAYSLHSMENKPDYPEPIIEGRRHSLDYAMDGIIANIIYSMDSQSLVESALLCKWHLPKNSEIQTSWQNLKYSVDHHEHKPNVVYGRYWHGNSFLFRFFFLLMDYNEIKWVIYILSSLLFLFTSIRLYQSVGIWASFSLLSGLFFVNAYIMQFSMQLSPVLFISLIGMILISKLKAGKEKRLYRYFLFFGAATSYFDLLTAPFLSFGLPFLVWFTLLVRENLFTPKKIMRDFLITGTLWLFAYAFIWVSKWILVSLFTDFHIWYDIKQQLVLRTGTMVTSRIPVIRINFNQLPLVWINLVLLACLIRSMLNFDSKRLLPFLSLLLIAFIPYLWYFLLANHSYDHFWFTYRIQAVSLSAVMLAIEMLHKNFVNSASTS